MILRLITWFMFAWILLGSAYLIYLQSIDGVLLNPPATFYVDLQHFQTDKTVYQRGDSISIFTSYCRNRAFEARTTWRLINATQIIFAEHISQMIPGCTTDKWAVVGVIPSYSLSGEHHLEGITAITLNPLHTIYLNFRSEDFEVQ